MSNSNKIINTITTGDANYDLQQAASAAVTAEIIGSPELQFFKNSGIINMDGKGTLTKGGSTITFYDWARIDSQGTDPNGDQYAQAKSRIARSRNVSLGEISESFQVDKEWTIEQQIAYSSVGSLKGGLIEQMKDFGKEIILAGIINQLFGNDATSISTQISSSSFTGETLDRVTLKNSVATSSNLAIGNQGAGGVTTVAGITSANTLTIQDWQNQVAIADSTPAGLPKFSRFGGAFNYYGILSTTAYFQMINQAAASGAASSAVEEMYRRMSSGEKFGALNTFELMLVPGVKFIVFPDSVMCRGTHSNAEVANTRCAGLVGKHALDFIIGKAYPSDAMSSMMVMIDNVTNKNNKKDNYVVRMLVGGGRVQKNGTGAYASTAYDTGVRKIVHYSAT